MSARHKRLLLTPLLCLCLTLFGCAQNSVPMPEADPALTLPPAETGLIAPIGDAALEYTAEITLYLPRHDLTRLTTARAQAAFSATRPEAESVVRALLAYPGDGVASAVAGSVSLSLYGANPVEISLNTATINLSASALQLDRHTLYIACQAIANTLTELDGIDYVNVLVMNKSVGFNISNSLPSGTWTRSVGQDVTAAYEQLLSRGVQAGESPKDQSLSSNVTLYFPIRNAPGLLAEVRTCSFGTQAYPDMVVTLLRELAAGPKQAIASPPLPLLSDLLTETPALTYSEVHGGDIVNLSFDYGLDDMLESYGISRANCLASICRTLCTYLPNVVGLRVSIGGVPVSTLMLTDDFESSVIFDQNVMRRNDFAPLMRDLCTLYFPSTGANKLVAVSRAVGCYGARSPRTLLMELAKGVENREDVRNLIPPNALTDADILGAAISGSTLLVNFAPAFLNLGTELDAEGERMLAYAMVNTLLSASPRLKDVAFFVSGQPFDGFTGEIYWRGLFYPLLY